MPTRCAKLCFWKKSEQSPCAFTYRSFVTSCHRVFRYTGLRVPHVVYRYFFFRVRDRCSRGIVSLISISCEAHIVPSDPLRLLRRFLYASCSGRPYRSFVGGICSATYASCSGGQFDLDLTVLRLKCPAWCWAMRTCGSGVLCSAGVCQGHQFIGKRGGVMKAS